MKENYYHTKKSVDEYINLANGFDGRYLINKLKSFLSPKATLLELGSGPGTDFAILDQEYTVTGSDFSEEFLKRLKETYGEHRFLHINAADIDLSSQFDAIYSNKVFQHLTDDELLRSITAQYKVLHHDGLICHSFWKGESEEEFKGMLVNYQTRESLEKYFGPLFDFLILEEYEEFEPRDSLLLIGRKKA